MMDELTSNDVTRMAREMMDRVRAAEAAPGESAEDVSIRLALIMAEYPPAVAYAYFLSALSQVVSGDMRVQTVPLRGRR